MNEPRTLDSSSPGLRAAATAIVLREHDGDVQVLMARRHASLAFMGGMWVFPGGALAPADSSDAARDLVVDADRCAFKLRDLSGQPLPSRTCLALAVAACRETFEEAGVLLARRSDDAPIDRDQLARLHEEREHLATDPALFVAALAQAGIKLDIDRLIYWAHWITPSGIGRRFDTRFFVARAPQDNAFVADTQETTECLWMSPDELLARAARAEMTIAQPTRYTLADLRASLGQHGTLDRLLAAEANRPVPAIMPKAIQENGRTTIVMPWDAEYPTIDREGVAASEPFGSALLQLPSRIERDH